MSPSGTPGGLLFLPSGSPPPCTLRPMDRVPGYILAGGRSRRFGTDKARAEVGGTPLLRHAAASLSARGIGLQPSSS